MRICRQHRSVMSELSCWQPVLLFLGFWLVIANAIDTSQTGDTARQKTFGSFVDRNIPTHADEFQHIADSETLRNHVSNGFKQLFYNSAPETGRDINTLPELLSALKVMQSEFFTLWQGTWTESI